MSKTVKKNARPVKKSYSSPFTNYWVKENYYLLILGAVILIAGFFVMSLGKWDNPVSLNLSPILLLIGYLVVLPAAIFFRKKQNDKKADNVPGQS
ncbi:MAG: DUF3098 domain-containing protein [Ignavibacteria bacterium]|jgi:general stress protein CsbA|nr:DUF3098 domain-containing protein [Ignavibacteria bacterium]MCU7503676.1 DUF3098 domain-containing protein [Ignavibacteria bacterium]MCU7518487.1 DUF3098 domain-containing protein [Ignavibacteria bacterium]